MAAITDRFDLPTVARNVAMFQIALACNFNCYYCCAGSPQHKDDPPPPFTNRQLLDVFERTGRKWWFVISGGETFLYPKFAELLSLLTRAGHWVSVDTNLSHDISEVLETVDPDYVVMFSCAYHPETEKDPARKQAFMERVGAFADNGFRVTIPYVMHPRRFDDYREAKREFADLGFRLTPQPCRAVYQGKTYPQDYTEGQKKVIYGDQQRPHLFELPAYLGRICHAGYSLVRIMPTGRIYRCPNHSTRLGDVAEEHLDLFDRPRPCDKEVCDCNRFVRQVDALPDLPSMIDSFAADITINESRIRRRDKHEEK